MKWAKNKKNSVILRFVQNDTIKDYKYLFSFYFNASHAARNFS